MVHVRLQFRDPLQLQLFLVFTACADRVVNLPALTVLGCYSCGDVALAIDHLDAEVLELSASPR